MIAEKQNESRQIMRLAAQRRLYSQAKSIFAVHAILSGPVAVVSAFVVLMFPVAKGTAALLGLFIVLLDIFLFTPWQKRLKTAAARIQEDFDCDVLEIPWNSLKAGARPDSELIKEKADEYEAKAKDQMPTLLNWYSSSASDVPLYIGRVACQRSNCWWDAKQKRRYAAWVIGSVACIFGILLIVGLIGGFTVEDCVLKVVAPLAPVLLLGIRQFIDQVEAAERLDRLKDHSRKLWTEALNGTSETEIAKESRNLQDEIFENRRRSPLVFDWIFKRLRNSYEAQMNHGVDEMVAEARSRLGLS